MVVGILFWIKWSVGIMHYYKLVVFVYDDFAFDVF